MELANCLQSARVRMGAYLVSDAAQARIARLNVNIGEFCADIMQAYARSADVASLDVTEVFAICEMAAKLRLRFAPRAGDAQLVAVRGRANLRIGFAGLYALTRGHTGKKAG